MRKPQPPPLAGALVINKPAGKTSHDVVEAVRRLAGFRQIGHLGTLDPLATGVLVLLLGPATRLAQFYSGRRKRYLCTVRFGFATNTYDADGEPLGPQSSPHITLEILAPLVAQLSGHLMQTPPPFSAKKIRGRPAHELARKNRPVELKPVEVDVYEFRLLSIEGTLARFSIECGAGTYIRSLAHDLGRLQGSGAHLAEIVRTAVGEFTLDQAVTLEDLHAAVHARQKNGGLAGHLLPPESLLADLPRTTVLPVVERRVRHGARFNVPAGRVQPGHVVAAQGAPEQLDSGERKPPRLRIFDQHEKLIAIAEAVVPGTYQPLVVLETA